ncbi:MAG: aminodeoxychorismate synthase component I [Desulfococcaceae bacterium]|nr:aminodeoxychorismate synthase component I [Desulfococcaceae bacterium]
MKNIIRKISGIHREKFVSEESFSDTAARFADLPGTVLLMSGGEGECSRFHILGIMPWLTFSGRGYRMSVQTGEQTLSFTADPFDTLREILHSFHPDFPCPPPIESGLLGYLSYDLKDMLEKLPRTSVDDLGLPHILFMAHSLLLIHDIQKRESRICIPRFADNGEQFIAQTLAAFRKTIKAPAPEAGEFFGDAGGFQSDFTRDEYMQSVEKIREYIAAGHVYQVNMSQRFRMGFTGDAFALFRQLWALNPAPFFAYIHAGDHQIVSTSPERFLLQEGRQVETRPIKGTRPRGKTAEEDRAMAKELAASAKDDAELSMIVDLLRNDIGKVCKAGSVRVSEHKRLEKYKNVYHLVSVVKGELDADKDTADLIRATFPGGSISGCPKIRAMEIIDELEPRRRHIYTGSIGYISFHGTADFSIAIRTATVCHRHIFFSVGGGIVFDSDPADEYEETLHKGQSLMAVFCGKQGDSGNITAPRSPCPGKVWMDGLLRPLTDARIPFSHPGFQYGYGFFETIRAVKGKCPHLTAHIQRFSRTWKHFLSGEPPDLSWARIIRQVLTENGLADQTAAVKITVAKGDRELPPANHRIIVSARPYTHRLAEKKKKGLSLISYPHPRQSPLADFKTLNYLYYLRAGEWAVSQGADEALIFNPDGSISESNTANILLLTGDHTLLLPVSPHVLPGIMEKEVCERFSRKGWQTVRKPLRTEDIHRADQVLLTNSLMGAVPVIALDGEAVGTAGSDLWEEINGEVL